MILCLNPHFRDLIKDRDVKFIEDVVPDFNNLSIIKKLRLLKASMFKPYKTIVFYRDHRLAFIYALLFGRKKKIILHEFYYPERVGGLKKLYFHFFVRVIDRIVVHSNFETGFLSNEFRVDPKKFQFIRYFCYDIGYTPSSESKILIDKKINILIPGRHRDLGIIDKLKHYDNIRFTIVCGDYEAIDISSNECTIHKELSKKEYDKEFSLCDIVLIPIKSDCTRSLGQIAIMKAFALGKPLIVTKSDVVSDYVLPSGCLQYEAENVSSLQKAIDRILTMSDYEKASMITEAYTFVNGFTREGYAQNFNQMMHDI